MSLVLKTSMIVTIKFRSILAFFANLKGISEDMLTLEDILGIYP